MLHPGSAVTNKGPAKLVLKEQAELARPDLITLRWLKGIPVEAGEGVQPHVLWKVVHAQRDLNQGDQLHSLYV